MGVSIKGSGKTTLLIQLALKLIENEDESIPLIINIATWRDRFNSVEEWLIELLPQIGISKSLSQILIKEKHLLPLFDGLDELAKEKRQKCLEAIGEYGESNNLKFAICSRSDEYTQTIDAPVYFQIEVRPLKMEQIKQQLKEVSTPESNGMLHAIKKDKLLAEAIQVPFYLNTTQILFSSGKALSEFGFKATDLDGRKEELVESFIDKSLKKNSQSKENANYWISFLAYEMNQHHLVIFELINLQYSWSKWSEHTQKKSYFLYGFIKGLVSGFVGGFFFGLLCWLSIGFGFFSGLLWSFFFGFVGALIRGLIEGLNSFLSYKKVSRLIFGLVVGFGSFSVFGLYMGLSMSLAKGLVTGLTFGLGLGLFMGSFMGFGSSFFRSSFYKKSFNNRKNINELIGTKEYSIWSAPLIQEKIIFILLTSLLMGVIGSLIVGIISFIVSIIGIIGIFDGNWREAIIGGFYLGFILSLVINVASNLIDFLLGDKNSFIQLKTPYQRFNASAKNLYFSIIQHFVLRYQLYHKGALPFRLVTFLKELTQNNLMESNGATWRFRHRILQDYFAELWEAKK